ncbi:restriction endonuclease subunit S [Fusobacterium hwasookii]|uniref:restriction endonuclease subunit S n=1 Tax=Fusobacterium hwasookii TaxID=1583098 RepID=UPI000A522043|nr:restriction endonuclease subunit S [Fusobacterium hwasookii]
MDRYFYFDDIFEDYTKYSLKISKSLYLKSGLYPIIDQGKEEIAGYSNKNINIFDKIPVIIFGDHTRIFKYVDYPFFLGADGVKILKNTSNLFLDKYLYYSLKNFKIPDTGYNRHFKWLKDFKIKYISLAKQKRITSLIEKIEFFILKKEKQLEYLKELKKSLFIRMFGDPLTNDRIEWKFSKIKNIGKIISGSTPNTNTPELWNGDYLWITPAELKDDSFIVNSTERKLTYLGIKKSSLIEMPIGTVLLSSRAPIGKVAIVGKNMFCNQGFKNIIPNEEINSIYLYYILKEKKEYLNFLGRGATFKELSKEIVENISLKIPPIELQNKFAERVEKIEKLSFEIEKSIKEAENLYNSLISKYFD